MYHTYTEGRCRLHISPICDCPPGDYLRTYLPVVCNKKSNVAFFCKLQPPPSNFKKGTFGNIYTVRLTGKVLFLLIWIQYLSCKTLRGVFDQMKTHLTIKGMYGVTFDPFTELLRSRRSLIIGYKHLHTHATYGRYMLYVSTIRKLYCKVFST